MAKLLMLQGLPGSGKSTLAEELTLPQNGGWVRVNKDDIRTELAKDGWVWSPKAESQVREIRDAKIMAALQSGKNVVSDDTNFGRKHRNTLSQIARVAGADFETLRLDIPLEVCLERNAKREGSARVPEGVIQKMWKDFVKENPYVFPKSAKPDSVVAEPYIRSGTKMKAIICDLDGTLAMCEGYRDVYDASNCDKTDKINLVVKSVLDLFWRREIFQILYLTGRDEAFREPTERFLKVHNCPPGPLFMRTEGDTRNGTITKLAIFNEHIRGKYDVIFALEDLDKIVKMWRSIGLTVLQVHGEGQ